MASRGIQNYYRQQKSSGISKPNRKSKPVKSPIGSDPISLKSSPLSQEEEYEAKLLQFDLDMRYGPCVGLTRMERWDRANSLGKNPPADVEAILLKVTGDGLTKLNECVWEGRV